MSTTEPIPPFSPTTALLYSSPSPPTSTTPTRPREDDEYDQSYPAPTSSSYTHAHSHTHSHSHSELGRPSGPTDGRIGVWSGEPSVGNAWSAHPESSLNSPPRPTKQARRESEDNVTTTSSISSSSTSTSISFALSSTPLSASALGSEPSSFSSSAMSTIPNHIHIDLIDKAQGNMDIQVEKVDQDRLKGEGEDVNDQKDKETELESGEKEYMDLDHPLSKLEDELQCGMCSAVFINPVVLDGCGHVFCGSCVTLWIRSMPPYPTSVLPGDPIPKPVSCPHCRFSPIKFASPLRFARTMVDVLVAAYPQAARSENERKQAEEVYSSANGGVIKFPSPPPPPKPLHNNEFWRPCKSCYPTEEGAWRCPVPVPRFEVPEERALCLRTDGICPDGHRLCAACNRLSPSESPTSANCALCGEGFCGNRNARGCACLPLAQCRPGPQWDSMQMAVEECSSDALAVAFHDNWVELGYLGDYLSSNETSTRLDAQSIFTSIIDWLASPEGIKADGVLGMMFRSESHVRMRHAPGSAGDPQLQFFENSEEGNEGAQGRPLATVCGGCVDDILGAGLFEWWMREMKKPEVLEKLPEGVRNRPNCKHGRKCERQDAKFHAKKYNHICEAVSEPEANAIKQDDTIPIPVVPRAVFGDLNTNEVQEQVSPVPVSSSSPATGDSDEYEDEDEDVDDYDEDGTNNDEAVEDPNVNANGTDVTVPGVSGLLGEVRSNPTLAEAAMSVDVGVQHDETFGMGKIIHSTISKSTQPLLNNPFASDSDVPGSFTITHDHNHHDNNYNHQQCNQSQQPYQHQHQQLSASHLIHNINTMSAQSLRAPSYGTTPFISRPNSRASSPLRASSPTSFLIRTNVMSGVGSTQQLNNNSNNISGNDDSYSTMGNNTHKYFAASPQFRSSSPTISVIRAPQGQIPPSAPLGLSMLLSNVDSNGLAVGVSRSSHNLADDTLMEPSIGGEGGKASNGI